MTNFKLFKIPGVKEEWESIHQLRALEINKKCPVLEYIVGIKIKNPHEYKIIMKVLKLIGSSDKIRNPIHVKPNKNHTGIYELRVHKGSTRILFFYFGDENSKAIFVTPFWINQKGKGDRQKQDSYFIKSAEIRDTFLSTRKV